MNPKESLDRALAHDVPLEAVALYARWWQMEVWLRQLAYFVLRSAWGVTWEEQVNAKAVKYRDNDNLTHLFGPDKGDLLAYLDFSLLLKIIEEEWILFEPFLLPKKIWLGRCEEFGTFRNRIGHLRRPAERDLERIETTLSDIEQGYREAWKAVSFATDPGDRPTDPVMEDFRRGEMRALIDNALFRYGRYALDPTLKVSRMPWAEVPDPPDPLAKTPGLFWQLDCGGPDIWVWPEDYRDALPPEVRRVLAYTLTPGPNGAVFAVPVVDDPDKAILGLAGALKSFLDSAVSSARIQPEDVEARLGSERDLDPYVLVTHPFALEEYPNPSSSIFGVKMAR